MKSPSPGPGNDATMPMAGASADMLDVVAVPIFLVRACVCVEGCGCVGGCARQESESESEREMEGEGEGEKGILLYCV